MPSVYYSKNSVQPDLKLCMDSACQRVEGKPVHKTDCSAITTIFKIIGVGERDIKFIRGIC